MFIIHITPEAMTSSPAEVISLKAAMPFSRNVLRNVLCNVFLQMSLYISNIGRRQASAL
ncbi:MAG: hypothetical protein AB3K77_11610 [Methanosarcinaceae archaeon]